MNEEESVEKQGEPIDITILPQAMFPLMEEYKKKFEITGGTIFALFPHIYCDHPLSPDLMVHEMVHIEQQAKVGVINWVYDFLEYPSKRLEYELEAYRKQLKSIKDREKRNKIRMESARNLSSSLYGNIISYQEAWEKLKI